MPQTYEYWDESSANLFQQQPQQQVQAGQSQSAPQAAAQVQSQGAPQQPPRVQAAQEAQAAATPTPTSTPAPTPAPQPVPQQVIYQMPPQKKSHGWIVAIVIILCLFALAAFGVKSCSDALGTGAYYGGSGAADADSVAIITLDGTIQYDGTACSPEGFKALLDEAEADDNIKAVVLRVNSGGGTATAGEEMATYLSDFSKPVVVSSASINASAAYEISSQANYIYVAKSTEIGAIGTAMELTDISGLLDMLGINMEVITSADSKDSSYGYRPLTEDERAYYQRMVTQINQMFIENVAKGRNMTLDQVQALATGLAYTGVDAVENGLADEVGTLEDATDKAAALAGISDYSLYDLTLDGYDLSELYGLFGYSQENSQSTAARLVQ